jgi:hypothetical protein
LQTLKHTAKKLKFGSNRRSKPMIRINQLPDWIVKTLLSYE